MNRCVLYLASSRELLGEVARTLQSAALDVHHAVGLAEALAMLRRNMYSAILTEACLRDATWREVLAHTHRTGLRCAVVVTDRLADDELWAEVLEAGAYDLLAQPLDEGEVRRVLASACGECGHMQRQTQSAAARPAL